MANWYKIPMTMKVTEAEYRANVTGINVVFGAVLGFVLAGAEDMQQLQFASLLIVSTAVVVMILYLASTEYKLFYAAMTAASIFAFPHIIGDSTNLADVPQLQTTLAVWALMIISVELLPRAPDSQSQPDTEEKDQ